MADADNTLRHLAFFEALGAMEETDPAWPATSAGLVVLRLIDAWLDEGAGAVAGDAWGMQAVREALAAVPAGPVRTVLAGIVDAMQATRTPDVATIAPRLMAYGRALDYDGRWALAADVFGVVEASTDPAEEPDLAVDAQMQLGYCRRMLGDWGGAATAYSRAGAIATASGDLVKVLRARMADAKLALARGNLPSAEGILDETIERAGRAGLGEVRALALHDRSAVAHLRGQYEQAVCLGYEALDGLSSAAARDRVLCDIAVAFMELGVLTAARDALLIVAATAREQYLRWIAALNLLEIASRDQREPVFEQYRRELSAAQLPPVLGAHFQLLLGQGYQRLGRLEPARTALERAQMLAGEHGLHQVAFQAAESLREVREVHEGLRVGPAASTAAPSRAVQTIAGQISAMRAAAGVGG